MPLPRTMTFLQVFRWVLSIGLCLSAAVSVTAGEQTLTVAVDATAADRHLLHCTISMPVSPGPLALWYPKWIPGIHGPGEQIRNIGGFTVRSAEGDPLDWRRDDDDLYQVRVDVPDGVERIVVDLTYICNQPTRVSTGVDSFGNAQMTIINFNTCLVYPDDWASSETMVELRVKPTPDWSIGTALDVAATEDGWIHFRPETLEDIVDSPLIAGKHYRRLDIATPNFPPTRMHFVAETAEALEFDEAFAEHCRRLMAEGAALFGGAPFGSYDFLVYCSDEIPGTGLEHLSSSLNGIDADGLTEENEIKSGPAYLLPHELVHAWCGKYRRPAGMYRTEFHSTKQTRLLWIYEGLTQYLGQVLTARSGFVPFDEHVQRLASRVGYLANRTGRRWRPLEDTAIAGHTLRGGSQNWNDLRRNQDYYDEGALFWLEVDAILREKTEGQKSLDDFCQQFFAVPANDKQPIKPFQLEEVVGVLAGLADYDWQGLINRRIMKPQDELSLEPIHRVGYRLDYVAERPEVVKQREQDRKYISAEYSLGITIDLDPPRVRSVRPASPADQAGLTEDMEFIAVNGKRFSEDRFRDALAATTETGEINFIVYQSDNVRRIQVRYDGGPRYPALTADPDEPNRLQAICEPHMP